MPPKADLNPKGSKYHFDRRDRAAKEGRHLPAVEEQYCGMSFLNQSLARDAQAWSERIIPSLAEKGQDGARNPVQTALERLSVSASVEDLRFVCDEIEKHVQASEKFAELRSAARRLTIYRVAAGDDTAWPLLCEDLVSRMRTLPRESAELWPVSSALFRLILNMKGPEWQTRSRAHSLDDFVTDGSSMLFRLMRLAGSWEEKGAKKSEVEKTSAVDVPPVPSAVGPSIVVFSLSGMRPRRTKVNLVPL
jgi:hypothetical protein